MNMMKKFDSICNDHFGRIVVEKHSIALNPPDAPLIHSAPYRTGPKQRKLERKETSEIQETGVAKTAVTKWASPVLFLSRKDFIQHFREDCRRHNAVTVRDSYVNLRMIECIDTVGELQIF